MEMACLRATTQGRPYGDHIGAPLRSIGALPMGMACLRATTLGRPYARLVLCYDISIIGDDRKIIVRHAEPFRIISPIIKILLIIQQVKTIPKE